LKASRSFIRTGLDCYDWLTPAVYTLCTLCTHCAR